MAPHRQMSHSSRRQPSQIQEIFLGLALEFERSKGEDNGQSKIGKLRWAGVLHDGTGTVSTEEFEQTWDDEKREEEGKKLLKSIFGLVKKLQVEHGMNVRVLAVAEPVPTEIRNIKNLDFFPKVWLHVDAIPFLVSPATTMFKNLPSPAPHASASSAVAMALKYLHPATHSATTASTDSRDHHVQVDNDGMVRLVSLMQYEESTSNELWKRFLGLSSLLKKNNVSISFFSATPQGGGVALMRHALLRLWNLVGLDSNHIKWYVPEGHPSVFDITKRKIHNVLQGVSDPGEEMSEEDKRWFESWTEQNYEAFWKNGALDASVIVIDDPQLTALIPIIKKLRPDAKIIFRSHIQIQSNLTDDPSTPQYRTWNYLFNFIKQADLFLAHPVRFFVPKNVDDHMPVLYMAPSTDPIDGLNKPYGKASLDYFRQCYNSLSAKQCGVEVDWSRGYICQIARFDPSKAIDWLLASYLEFRKRIAKKHEEDHKQQEEGGRKIPQLIILGHGSVDDPDGTVIYEKTHDILASSEYADVKHDVSVVRAPPSDSILGCILQGAWMATQLSTREGFEVKVTEAVHKGIPIIASSAGGIPLQVKHGINGWVVPTNDINAVASTMEDYWLGKISIKGSAHSKEGENDGEDPNTLAEKFCRDFQHPMAKVHPDSATGNAELARGATSEDFWTVGNATRWMLVISRLLGLESIQGEDIAEGVLESMDIGKPLHGAGVKGENVWKMVMGDKLVDGEAEIRWEGS